MKGRDGGMENTASISFFPFPCIATGFLPRFMAADNGYLIFLYAQKIGQKPYTCVIRLSFHWRGGYFKLDGISLYSGTFVFC